MADEASKQCDQEPDYAHLNTSIECGINPARLVSVGRLVFRLIIVKSSDNPFNTIRVCASGDKPSPQARLPTRIYFVIFSVLVSTIATWLAPPSATYASLLLGLNRIST